MILRILDNASEVSGSDSVEAAVKDILSKNTTLGQIDMECVDLSLTLNRGRRRAFGPKISKSVPADLWPGLLARASKTK